MLALGSGRALAVVAGRRAAAFGAPCLAAVGAGQLAPAVGGLVSANAVLSIATRRWLGETIAPPSASKPASGPPSGSDSASPATLEVSALRMQLLALPFLLHRGWTRRGDAFFNGSVSVTLPTQHRGQNDSAPQKLIVSGPSPEVNEWAAKLQQQFASIAEAANAEPTGRVTFGEFTVRHVDTQAYQVNALFESREDSPRGKGMSIVGAAKHKFDVWIFRHSNVKMGKSASPEALAPLTAEYVPQELRVLGRDDASVEAAVAYLRARIPQDAVLPLADASFVDRLRFSRQSFMILQEGHGVRGQLVQGQDGAPQLWLTGARADVDKVKQKLEPLLQDKELLVKEIQRLRRPSKLPVQTPEGVASSAAAQPDKPANVASAKPNVEMNAAEQKSMPFARKFLPEVLGPRHATLHELEKQYQVRFVFPARGEPGTLRGTDETVNLVIAGDAENVDACAAVLRAKIDSATGIMDQMTVPKEFAPRLLAFKGAQLHQLNDDFGVVSWLDRTVENGDDRLLRITGPPEAVEKVKLSVAQTIQELSATLANSDITKKTARDAKSPSPEKKSAARTASSEIRPVQGELKVPAKLVQAFMGPGSARIRRWRKESDVGYDFAPQQSEGDATLIVRGSSAETVQAAKDKASEILARLTSATLPLDAKQVAILMPSTGRVMHAALQAEFNVILSLRPINDPNHLTIEGDVAEVQKAKEGILAKVNDALSKQAVGASSKAGVVAASAPVAPSSSSASPDASGAHSIELDVHEDAGIVIGAGGREIMRLRETFSVFAEFNENRKLQIRGKRADVERAEQEVMAKLEHARRRRAIPPTERHWVEFRIPQERMGLIIGPSGATVSRLRQEFAVNINVREAGGQSVVAIEGRRIDVEKAQAGIAKMVEEAEKRSVAFTRDTGGSTEAHGAGGKYSLDMVVPKGSVGLLIGPGGSTISRLRNEYNVHMTVVGKERGEVLVIEGQRSDVEKAQEAVARLLAEPVDRRSGPRGGGGTGASSSLESRGTPVDRYSSDMDVPQDSISYLIGPGGATINRLRNEFNVHMHIRGDEKEVLHIQGRREDVEKAKAAVAEYVQERQARRARPRPGGFAGGRDLNIPPGETHEVKVEVPAQAVGYIIGPGGSTIKRIRAEFNVNAFLGGQEAGNMLLLGGREADVQQAQAEISKLVAEAVARKSQGETSDSVVVEVAIEAGLAGRIIGPAGSTIRRLQEQLGVGLRLNRAGEGDGDVLRIFSKDKDLVEKAKVEIETKILPSFMKKRGGRRGRSKYKAAPRNFDLRSTRVRYPALLNPEERQEIVRAHVEQGLSVEALAKQFLLPEKKIQAVLELHKDIGVALPLPDDLALRLERAVTSKLSTNLPRLKQGEPTGDGSSTLPPKRLVTIANNVRIEFISHQPEA